MFCLIFTKIINQKIKQNYLQAVLIANFTQHLNAFKL